MRHRRSRLHLNRFTSWRKATLISLAKNLLIFESIHSTKTKAQAVKPLIEKLIGLAKDNSLAARRRAFQILGDHKLVKLLFDDIGKRFEKRASGFTRMMHLGSRRGDNAEIVILELTEIKKKEIKKPKKEKEEKPEVAPGSQAELPAKEKTEEKKPVEPKVEQKPPLTQKPTKKFFGGIKGIFKKERDSL